MSYIMQTTAFPSLSLISRNLSQIRWTSRIQRAKSPTTARIILKVPTLAQPIPWRRERASQNSCCIYSCCYTRQCLCSCVIKYLCWFRYYAPSSFALVSCTLIPESRPLKTCDQCALAPLTSTQCPSAMERTVWASDTQLLGIHPSRRNIPGLMILWKVLRHLIIWSIIKMLRRWRLERLRISWTTSMWTQIQLYTA
jgi:hypothetical protein